MNDQIKVLFIASEAEPVIKIGGLADVAGSLPAALKAISVSTEIDGDIDIRLAIPFHPELKDRIGPVRDVGTLVIPSIRGPMLAQFYILVETEAEGSVPIYLIDGPPIKESPTVYSDNILVDGWKYVFFSLAALGIPEAINWQPDILHANDWHTAPAVYSAFLDRSGEGAASETQTVLSIHNLPYTGAGAETALEAFGLPPAASPELPWWAQNQPLPVGLVTADRLVAVSPNYAREICTPEFGAGLEGLLQARGSAISGILNGIDQDLWDPAMDPSIRMQYSLSSLPARLRNKSALQMEADLPISKDPLLLSIVSRMVHQKGIDLAIEALQTLGDANWQAVILGSGDPQLETAALALQEQYPNQVRVQIGYDPNLSRRIFAGADAILIPSRYEPSGLTQMIGMRYGCVPIARATGGLADTITDYTESREGNGFLFEPESANALATVIARAIEVFPNKRKWQGIQRRGMMGDYSWGRSARQYYALYQEMLRS